MGWLKSKFESARSRLRSRRQETFPPDAGPGSRQGEFEISPPMRGAGDASPGVRGPSFISKPIVESGGDGPFQLPVERKSPGWDTYQLPTSPAPLPEQFGGRRGAYQRDTSFSPIARRPGALRQDEAPDVDAGSR